MSEEQGVKTETTAAVSIAVLMPHAPVLVPAVAGNRLSEVAATVRAMREAARRMVGHRPDALVVISPHSPRRPGAFGLWAGPSLCGSLATFGAPTARIHCPVDQPLADGIRDEAAARGLAVWDIAGEPLDHGAIVPLWFMAEAGWSGPTVLLGLNHPDEPGRPELGESIAAAGARTRRRLALLASGDMSHRLKPGAPCGFHPRAASFDRQFIKRLERGQYRELLELDPDLQELAAEDAVDSAIIAAAATGWSSAGHEMLSYEGPFGVGYGVAILYERAGD